MGCFWRLISAPHFIQHDNVLREQDRVDLATEYRTFFAGLLQRLLPKRSELHFCIFVDNESKIQAGYLADESAISEDNLIGLRFLRIERAPEWLSEGVAAMVSCPPLGAISVFKKLKFTLGGDTSFLEGEEDTSSAGTDLEVLPYGGGQTIPTRGQLYLIPTAAYISTVTGDDRWLRVLSVLSATGRPGLGVVVSVVPKTVSSNDVSYSHCALQHLLATYSRYVEYPSLREDLLLMQTIAAQQQVYEIKILVNDLLAQAFIEDTDCGALVVRPEGCEAPPYDWDDETRDFVWDRLARMHTEDEAAWLLLPPFSFRDALPGVENVVPKPSVVPGVLRRTPQDSDLVLGVLENGVQVRLPLNDLAKHLFVGGSSGSGKTWFLRDLLRQLPESVPFLIIDPVKDDYEEFADSLSDCKKPRIVRFGRGPVRANIFKLSRGITVQALTAFLARFFSLLMPSNAVAYEYLLGMIRFAYSNKLKVSASERSIDLTTNDYEAAFYGSKSECSYQWYRRKLGDNAEKECIPDITDIETAGMIWLEQVLAGRDGAPQAGQYAVETRQHFERWWKLASSVHPVVYDLMSGRDSGAAPEPTHDLFELLDQNSIVLLGGVPTDEESNAICSLVLYLLALHRKANSQEAVGSDKRTLRHVTVIEEAHRVMPGNARGYGEKAMRSPEEESAAVMSQLLAEIRSAGEGIIISEQSPGKLVSDAMINTGTKVLKATSFGPDVDALASSLGLADREKRLMGRLTMYEAMAVLPGAEDYVYITRSGLPGTRDQ